MGSNFVITNNDLGDVALEDIRVDDDTLNLDGAQTVAEGTILARDSVSGKLVLFVPGGEARKATGDGPFNLAPADTLVVDVDNVGNATATFDAAAASITDTTTYAVADQDTLTSVVTLTGGDYDGEAQTVLFAVTTTTAAVVASQMNAQLKGCSVAVAGGQVVITHDDPGTDGDIAVAAGTGALTWAASVAGTGDVGNINAVTATEVKTVVEADTTADVAVVGAAAVFTAGTELDFISGAALAPLGLSVETITANENGIPKKVLQYELVGANGDNFCRPIKAGGVRTDRLVANNGTTVTKAMLDQLRDYGIIPRSVNELGKLDNQ